ncbi:MAG: FG-GAP-like repeat-containing protein [Terriglobia bacterium]
MGSAIAFPGKALLAGSSASAVQTEPTAKIPLRIIVVETLSGAQQIVDRLKKGEDFAALAVEKSIDPSADQGGFLGTIDPTGLRPELREALNGIGPGEFSGVVRIPAGYAILKRDQTINAMGVQSANPNALTALTGPGAVIYGPDVDGFFEDAFTVFLATPGKPKDWAWDLNPVTAAQLHQRCISSALKQLQNMLSPENPENLPIVKSLTAHYLLAQLHAFQGDMEAAIDEWMVCYQLTQSPDPKMANHLEEVLAIAYLHKSQMDNEAFIIPGDRCLFPMSKSLRYEKSSDSEKAVEYFLRYLKQNPDDLEAKWLLNLSCMTLGQSPPAIPHEYLVPLDGFESKQNIGRFVDVAPEAGLNVVLDAGGIIVDDFENHGLFDVVMSEWGLRYPKEPMLYFHNNGDGTFSDQTKRAGLSGMLGGLNIIQADYNNDGCLDVLVLRGAWLYPQPLSLLRGNGDGTFTEVTKEAGLSGLMATQAAAWADINNDGLLDLFIGNENGPSHLFLNKGDGTFEDISASSGVDKIAFSKGVVADDYDNDGYVDFYITNIGSSNFLYHNEHNNTFKEVGREAGVQDPLGHSFATWWFDYDNDGWPDIFVTSYYSGSVDENIRTYLGLPHNAATLKLYKNMRNGTFRDVTADVGLDKVFLPMGANFGDVDNDGFLDVYLGTGNPSYGSLVPNVLLRNDEGKKFVDITASSGTGELHKGHGVAFADMSNNGQQDLLTVIGGATPGDEHVFRYFKNPGNANNWVTLKLVGVKSNRAGMGARIKVTLENKGRGRRFIYRTVGSGGSFGASPLQQHIGLGPAARIEEIEVWWPASNARQVFTHVATNQVIEVKEFATEYTALVRPKLPQLTPMTLRG